jgi:hypothetical protein
MVTRPSKYAARYLPLLYRAGKIYRICFLEISKGVHGVVIILTSGVSFYVNDEPRNKWWKRLAEAKRREADTSWNPTARKAWAGLLANCRNTDYYKIGDQLVLAAWGATSAYRDFLYEQQHPTFVEKRIISRFQAGKCGFWDDVD